MSALRKIKQVLPFPKVLIKLTISYLGYRETLSRIVDLSKYCGYHYPDKYFVTVFGKRIYLFNQVNSILYTFDSSVSYLQQRVLPGIENCHDIAAGKNYLYVSDNSCIRIFSLRKKPLLKKWNVPYLNCSFKGLTLIPGKFLSQKDEMIVAAVDSYNSILHFFNFQGVYLFRWVLTQFKGEASPEDISVCSKGIVVYQSVMYDYRGRVLWSDSPSLSCLAISPWREIFQTGFLCEVRDLNGEYLRDFTCNGRIVTRKILFLAGKIYVYVGWDMYIYERDVLL